MKAALGAGNYRGVFYARAHRRSSGESQIGILNAGQIITCPILADVIE